MDFGLYNCLTSSNFGLPITTVPLQVIHSISTFTFKCSFSNSDGYKPSINPCKIDTNIYSIKNCIDLMKVSYDQMK